MHTVVHIAADSSVRIGATRDELLLDKTLSDSNDDNDDDDEEEEVDVDSEDNQSYDTVCRPFYVMVLFVSCSDISLGAINFEISGFIYQY